MARRTSADLTPVLFRGRDVQMSRIELAYATSQGNKCQCGACLPCTVATRHLKPLTPKDNHHG